MPTRLFRHKRLQEQHVLHHGHPHDNVLCRVFNAKRLIGRRFSDDVVQNDMQSWPFKVVEGPDNTPHIKVRHGGITLQLAPEQISAMLLTRIKAYANSVLNEDLKQLQAVITVPAHFTDGQRAATKNAAEIAGLEVLRIMTEPMAAALTYGMKSSRATTSKVLIYDLGGGTCDVSILEIGRGTTQALAVHGDSHLGGEDFDQRLVEYLLEVCMLATIFNCCCERAFMVETNRSLCCG